MISSDFAMNETATDSFSALSLLFQPWKWYKGKAVEQLKKNIERKFFPDHTVHLFLSARAALYYLLLNLRLPKKAEVIVQAFTCEAVILPLLELNLKPVYVDIEPKNFSMQLEDLKKKISSDTKVVILQHSFGIPPLYREDILSLCKDNKILVIEDMAHGWDLKATKTEPVKTIKLLSFGRSKVLSSVFGGALAVKDYALNQKLKKNSTELSFPSVGFILRTLLYKILSPVVKFTYPILLGKLLHLVFVSTHLFIPEISDKEKRGSFDYNLSKAYPNALALLLLVQLKKYKALTKLRTNNTALYMDSLDIVHPLQQLLERPHSLIRYPFLVDNPALLLKIAGKQGLYFGQWYDQMIAPKAISLKKMKYVPGSCPVAEKICQSVINLPTHIERPQTKKIITLIQTFQLQNHGN